MEGEQDFNINMQNLRMEMMKEQMMAQHQLVKKIGKLNKTKNKN